MASCCGLGSMTCLLEAWWYVRVVLPTSGCIFIGDLFMWPTVLEEGCFALTDTHSLAVEGGKEYPITNLALPESVGFSLMSLTWVEASMAPLMCASGHDFQKPFFLGYKVCTSWQCLATWSEWMEVWYPISCWRSCESRGIELCAR